MVTATATTGNIDTSSFIDEFASDDENSNRPTNSSSAAHNNTTMSTAKFLSSTSLHHQVMKVRNDDDALDQLLMTIKSEQMLSELQGKRAKRNGESSERTKERIN